jgi:hypothetical protein
MVEADLNKVRNPTRSSGSKRAALRTGGDRKAILSTFIESHILLYMSFRKSLFLLDDRGIYVREDGVGVQS